VQIPYIKLTIIGKSYEDTTPALEQVMVADGLIPTVNKVPKTWHLIQDPGSTVNGYPSFDCDARFLVDYLDLVDSEGKKRWEAWNKKFPESAKIFWPLVAELARDEMYLAIPGVMRFALQIDRDEPTKFESRLAQIAAADYLEFGTIDQNKNRLERALNRLTKSIEKYPSQDAYRHRAEVLKQLGRADAAESDQVNASEMLPEKESSD
jgi:tetratricopeptide (TPR) repeat protein